MIQNPSDEERHWSQIDLDNPTDLHGDPPYDVERVADRIIGGRGMQLRILDMGCGIGRLTNLIATRLPGSSVYGFDISTNNVFRAVDGAPPNVNYWRSDGRTIPCGITGRFDLIYSITVLQHLRHDVKWSYICQAAERLRPGGTFVCTVAVGDEPPSFLNHQLTEQELVDLAAAMMDLFSNVAVDGPDENNWTWLEARA